MSKAISDFTSGETSILLLSQRAKASGANLQCASNVVLLDPAGSSAEHGATLEKQAIGRAVRMGQENAVSVIRFCVSDSIEETLYTEIGEATAKLEFRSSDNTYTCEDADKEINTNVMKAKASMDEDEICIGESVSEKERIARNIAAAKAKNEIIIIDDSDDEDEEEEKKPSGTMKKSIEATNEQTLKPSSAALVKSEMDNMIESSKPVAVTAKRANAEVDEENNSCNRPEKRAKLVRETFLKTDKALYFSVSPGDLGLSFSVSSGGATIDGIEHSCTFSDKVEVGDVLVSIDGKVITNEAVLSLNKDKTRSFKVKKSDCALPRVVSPLEETTAATLEEPVTDGLKDLLTECQLESYLPKFVSAGVSSVLSLTGKEGDAAFMGQLVEKVGLTASEAISFQIHIAAKR